MEMNPKPEEFKPSEVTEPLLHFYSFVFINTIPQSDNKVIQQVFHTFCPFPQKELTLVDIEKAASLSGVVEGRYYPQNISYLGLQTQTNFNGGETPPQEQQH